MENLSPKKGQEKNSLSTCCIIYERLKAGLQLWIVIIIFIDTMEVASEKTTIKIIIASSSEVKEEREKSISVCLLLNKVHRHLFLEPVLWEYDMDRGNFYGSKNIDLFFCRFYYRSTTRHRDYFRIIMYLPRTINYIL